MLLIDDNDDQEFFKDTKYVDFTKDANGYFAILALIEELITKGEINKLTQEFKDEYAALQASFNDKAVNKLRVKGNSFWQRFLLTTLVLGMIITGIGVIYQFNNSLNKNAAIETELDKLIKISEKRKLLSNNITKGDLKKVYMVANQIEVINNLFSDLDIEEYFKDDINSDKLLEYVYLIYSAAAYYNHNNHDGVKARAILMKAKNLIEHHINNLSIVDINFNTLKPDEILSELNIIQDLPEIYTRIMYRLGRTYIYQGDINDAKPYFELAKYLGNKLDLFEGYLAIRSGQIVTNYEINADIKNGDYKQAIPKLEESIERFRRLRNDTKQYRINYKLGILNPEIIIPKNNIFNWIRCNRQIARFYTKLLKITDDHSKKMNYTEKILSIFLETKMSPGILEKSRYLLPKKVADVYNDLGNVLIILYDENLNIKQIKNYIIRKFDLIENSSDLDVIYQVFKEAEFKSRNCDHTKADAYNGMIEVYKRKLTQNISLQERDQILIEIKNLENKQTTTNKKLFRKENIW